MMEPPFHPRLFWQSRSNPCLRPGFFLLQLQDCMLETCMLLAGLRVHELWWPQKKPFRFTSINYKIKSNDRSLPVQSFSSSCQSLARPSWSGIPDSICCRANRSLLLRRHLRPPLPRPLQGEASGLGKWRHHHRHLKKRKILNKNFHRNGLLQNK